MQLIRRNRYVILRRMVQVSLLFLFIAGHVWGWKVLQGDLSSSRIFGVVPLADPYALLQIAFTGTLVGAEALVGGLIVVVLFALIGGRVFCGWVCPMNIVTDLASSLQQKLRIQPRVQISGNARYWILGLGLLLSSILGLSAFESISPVSALHRGLIFGFGTGWTLIAAVFLFDLTGARYGTCGHLCPLGAFYALIGSAGFIRVMHHQDRCTECMQCIQHCPEPQVLSIVGNTKGFITSGECTNCGKCIDVCNDDAMNFSIRTFGNTK